MKLKHPDYVTVFINQPLKLYTSLV